LIEDTIHATQWWQPQSHCVTLNPLLRWTWTATGVVTGVAFLAVSWLLWRNLRSTRCVRALWWGCPFILSCGFSHLWGAVTLWRPYYAGYTVSHIATALISSASAIGLARVLPKLLPNRHNIEVLSLLEEAQEFVDTLADPAFVTDRDGGEITVNKEFMDLLGVSLEEVLGYSWSQRITEDTRDNYVLAWLDFVHGRTATYEERCKWVRGDEIITIETRGGKRTNGQFFGTVRVISEKELSLESDGVL
jgi:PAS domain S-box-containing protein